MYLAFLRIITDERLGSLSVRGSYEIIVAVTVRIGRGSLIVRERNRCTIFGERSQRVVIYHLGIVQIDAIVVICLVEKASGGIG